MAADRDVRRDLFALALLVFAVFMGLSLATYNPADPVAPLIFPLNQLYQPDILIYPPATVATNVCGPWGSLAAALVLDAIGLGAYYFVATLGILTLLMLLRRQIDSPVLRTIGWALSLVGLCGVLDMVIPWWTPGPVIGSGGYLGAAVGGLLRLYLATVGGLVLAISALLAGLLLCTDYVLVHLGLVLGTLTLASVSRCRTSGGGTADAIRLGGRRGVGDSDQVSVRVRGRKVCVAAASGLDDAEEEPCSDTEDAPRGQSGPGHDAPSYPRIAAEEASDEVEDEPGVDAEAEPVNSPTPTLLRASRGRRRHTTIAASKKPEPEAREEVMQQLDEASLQEDATNYELPSLDLLDTPDDYSFDEQAREVQRKARVLEKTFQSFGFDVKVVEIETGPVIAQYEVALEAGLRLSKITGLADDLAIALRVPSVRIVAPIPGKNTVGIEVPNDERQLVRLREVMEESTAKLKKMRIPIFLGKDVSGNPMTVDLSAMPHLLIAGRTGTGKSVCLNAIIASILMTRRPDEVRMLMIDPKMVELSGYKSLPHLMHPVVTDMRKAEAILAWAVDKMEERYELLASVGVRHISGYNQLSQQEILDRLGDLTNEERDAVPLHMPYIVIVADEMADLMMTSGKEVEQHIIRLAQKSRAVGIHLILATQKPTVDVITGLIKSNLPARIAFQVSSRTDSRVVLDEMGADKLLGNGDMLFLWPGTSTLMRGQGTYLSDEEINAIVDVVSTGEQNFVHELVELKVDKKECQEGGGIKQRDELYDDAVEVVIREGRGSVSLLQRALGIGYGRAARLIDYMAEDGIVGTYAGSQAREVLMTLADYQQLREGNGESDPSPANPTEPRRQVSQAPGYDPEDAAEEEDDDPALGNETERPAPRLRLLGNRKRAVPRRAAALATASEGDIDDLPGLSDELSSDDDWLQSDGEDDFEPDEENGVDA